MKITKTQLLKVIKEELNEVTQGEMEFQELEDARRAYMEDKNDDTRHELGLMINKLVEPILAPMGFFGEQGMVGEPEAQTELPLGKGGLAREHKVRITKSQLQKIIKEELGEEAESRYPERGSQDEAQYEVMVQMGKFLARLFNEGHNELADEFSQILDQADKAGMRGRMGW